MGGCLPSWKLCPDFDSTVSDAGAVSGGDSRTLDGIDDGACRTVAYGTTGLVVCGGIKRRGVGPTGQRLWVGGVVGAVGEVIGVTVQDVVEADGVRGQGWCDVEVPVLDVGVV